MIERKLHATIVRQDWDIVPCVYLRQLTPTEQAQAHKWMWSVASDSKARENQVWCALDQIASGWGDRDACILLDGYVDGEYVE
jgi:hypothetical protein